MKRYKSSTFLPTPGHTSFPWTVLGVHIAAAIAILAWSIFWSTLLFGALKYFKMLRVSTEMEFKGMDLVKHGEAAYPAGAWVEYQYNKTEKGKDGEATTNPCMSGGGVIAGTITMDGAKMNVDGEVYNNPFEMVGLVILFFFCTQIPQVPTTGKLMKQMSSTFLAAAAAGSPFLDSPFLLIYFHNSNPYVFASFISVAFPQMVSLCCGSFHTLLHAFETAFCFSQTYKHSFLHSYTLFLCPLACRAEEHFKLFIV